MPRQCDLSMGSVTCGLRAGPFWDTHLHVADHAGLALALAYATAEPKRTNHRVFLVLGLAIAYGIELVQAPLPERDVSDADMLANVFGALLASTYVLLEPRLAYVPLFDRSRG